MRQVKGLLYGEATRNRRNLLLGGILLGGAMSFLWLDREQSVPIGMWAGDDVVRTLITFLLMLVTVAVLMQSDTRGRLRMRRSTLERLLPTGSQEPFWVAAAFQSLVLAVLSVGYILVWYDAFHIRAIGDSFPYVAMTAFWSASLVWIALGNAPLRWAVMVVVSTLAAYVIIAEDNSSFARLLFFLYGLHVMVMILREH